MYPSAQKGALRRAARLTIFSRIWSREVAIWRLGLFSERPAMQRGTVSMDDFTHGVEPTRGCVDRTMPAAALGRASMATT